MYFFNVIFRRRRLNTKNEKSQTHRQIPGTEENANCKSKFVNWKHVNKYSKQKTCTTTRQKEKYHLPIAIKSYWFDTR